HFDETCNKPYDELYNKPHNEFYNELRNEPYNDNNTQKPTNIIYLNEFENNELLSLTETAVTNR
ncbi:15909_t:CDS:1, partial [Cetraspora pellucida]